MPRRLLLGVVLVVGAAAAVAAPPTATEPDLTRAGWRLFTLDHIPPTRFEAGPGGTIVVVADRSFGLLYMPVPQGDRRKHRLVWRWRVDYVSAERPAISAEHDDRPIALHVWFEDVIDSPTSLLRAVGRSLGALFGYPIPGRALTYSWGGIGKRGDLLRNPVLGDHGAIRILRDDEAPSGVWVEESVDLDADFHVAFGTASPQATHLAISADMDDTLGTSRAAVAAIAFRDSPP